MITVELVFKSYQPGPTITIPNVGDFSGAGTTLASLGQLAWAIGHT